MSKSHFRVILSIAMCITLCLPIDPEVGPIWRFILWYSMEFAPGMFHLDLSTIFFVFAFLLYLWAVPILITFNVCLLVLPTKELKMVYRILLLVLVPLMWFATLIMEYRGIGFWASPVVVSAAALLEIFLIKGWLEKPGKVHQE